MSMFNGKRDWTCCCFWWIWWCRTISREILMVCFLSTNFNLAPQICRKTCDHLRHLLEFSTIWHLLEFSITWDRHFKLLSSFRRSMQTQLSLFVNICYLMIIIKEPFAVEKICHHLDRRAQRVNRGHCVNSVLLKMCRAAQTLQL